MILRPTSGIDRPQRTAEGGWVNGWVMIECACVECWARACHVHLCACAGGRYFIIICCKKWKSRRLGHTHTHQHFSYFYFQGQRYTLLFDPPAVVRYRIWLFSPLIPLIMNKRERKRCTYNILMELAVATNLEYCCTGSSQQLKWVFSFFIEYR